MPRGTRALHELRNIGQEAGSEAMVMYVAESDYVAVECWCETTTVAVPTWAIGDPEFGTLSCGRDQCHSPAGDRTTGMFIKPQALSSKQQRTPTASPVMTSQALERYRANCPVLASRVRVYTLEAIQRDRDAVTRHTLNDIAVRRDMVESLNAQGKRRIDIANMLDVPLYTIVNDLNWLKTRGRA